MESLVIEAVEPINISALDTLKLVLGSDFPELLRDFNHHCTNDLIKLEVAIAKVDRAAMRDIAHSLKGSALSLHAKPLADYCAVLEAAAVSSSKADLEQSISAVREAVKEVISALSDWAYQDNQ
jgi:HPt (histidine-containing phosphotransfer) domain-containing protein|tara:strand:+ start:367 stop:738 length:372 start_codon:yes stop_codon:yes gene_type:complete